MKAVGNNFGGNGTPHSGHELYFHLGLFFCLIFCNMELEISFFHFEAGHFLDSHGQCIDVAATSVI